jgi:hypothetical protein
MCISRWIQSGMVHISVNTDDFYIDHRHFTNLDHGFPTPGYVAPSVSLRSLKCETEVIFFRFKANKCVFASLCTWRKPKFLMK